jgi:ACS family hexuronate transporter-like MFS transporter
MLGAGEGGVSAATKAVAEWFPARERSTAMGMINAGTAVGAVIAPPSSPASCCKRIGGGHSSCGAAGLVWTLWWARDTQAAEHRDLSPAERETIREVFSAPAAQEAPFPGCISSSFDKSGALVLAKF